MAVVYLLAHFDDEYGALPLVLRRARAGVEQRFLYVADYATPELAATRLAETRALLASLGVDPAQVRHLAAARDGHVHEALPAVLAAVRGALAGEAVDAIVTLAWEGGHADHDACAFIAAGLGAPVEQFGLYNGRGLPGPLFRACAPIPENGPAERVPLSAAEWLAYLLAVRFFPSQWKAWLGLWPAMFVQFALHGFRVQRLAPGRVMERPHPGPLLYERRSKVAYADLRKALDAL